MKTAILSSACAFAFGFGAAFAQDGAPPTPPTEQTDAQTPPSVQTPPPVLPETEDKSYEGDIDVQAEIDTVVDKMDRADAKPETKPANHADAPKPTDWSEDDTADADSDANPVDTADADKPSDWSDGDMAHFGEETDADMAAAEGDMDVTAGIDTGAEIETTADANEAAQDALNSDGEIAAETDAELTLAAQDITGSELIGAKVYDPEGEAAATVTDVRVDAEGRAQTLILTSGGLLGIGGETAEIDFDQATPVWEDDTFRLNIPMTKEAIRAGSESEQAENKELRLLSEIMGSEVAFSNSGEEATIVDLVMDTEGSVKHAVIADGVIAGIGGENRAVKMSDLKVAENNSDYVLDMTPEAFRETMPKIKLKG